jgi:Zn-dependent protease
MQSSPFATGGDPFSGKTNDNQELLKAWAGTSLAYAIFMLGGQIFVLWQVFPKLLLISAATCGIGFVLHELAHRIVARGYGAEAHFVADNGWLVLSILVGFASFFIAAPGAVWHRGNITRMQSGLISLAGPATNMALAVVFLVLYMLFGRLDFWSLVFSVGYQINAWLGLFNMLPFGPIDGAKVLNWNPVVFGVAVAIAVALVFVVPGIVGI